MRSLFYALRFLTVFPVPLGPENEKREETAAASLWYYPIVGLVVGGALVLCAGGLEAVFPAPLAAWGVVSVWCLVTGGLHLDGLADAADALGSWRSRERRLEIMRDPHVGAAGVCALVVVLLGKGVALGALDPSEGWRALLLAPLVARSSVVILLGTIPSARSEGMAKRYEGKAGGVLLGWAVCSMGLGIFLLAPSLRGGIILSLVILASLGGMRLVMRHGFGGVTGDLCGAACELQELLCLLVSASYLWGTVGR
jgi:adenosylcobinamide-GDP ribazoletransferase